VSPAQIAGTCIGILTLLIAAFIALNPARAGGVNTSNWKPRGGTGANDHGNDAGATLRKMRVLSGVVGICGLIILVASQFAH
jgi:hypothetical protein